MECSKALKKIMAAVVLLGVFVSGEAATISGGISVLNITNCCAEAIGSSDGMIKVQLVSDNQSVNTAYVLPSAKNYNQMLAVLLLAQSTSQVVTIQAGVVNGQNVISGSQAGGVYIGVMK